MVLLWILRNGWGTFEDSRVGFRGWLGDYFFCWIEQLLPSCPNQQ